MVESLDKFKFGCNIKFSKFLRTHPTFHRYYPCWLCLKCWLKHAFLSSRISESDSKLELIVCSRERWLALKLSWYAETSLLVQSSDAWPFLFLDFTWKSFLFYMKILTKFLKDLGAVKGRLLLFKITIVQKMLQIPHITKNFYKIMLSKSLLNSLRIWVP